jgi:O-antigen/teichoic acid export membrane protein
MSLIAQLVKRFQSEWFSSDLTYSYIVQGLGMLLGLLQLILINKYFGVAVYGQLVIVMSSAGIFSSLFTARTSEAVTRFYVREELSNNYNNAKFVIFTGFSIDLITALVLVIAIYLASDLVANSLLKDQSLAYAVFAYSGVSFLVFMRGSLLGYLQARKKFFHFNSIALVESISRTTSLLLIIKIGSNNPLRDLVVTYVLSATIAFFYAAFACRATWPLELKHTTVRFNNQLFREYWVFNLKTFASSSLKTGSANIDNMILGFFANPSAVGVYQTLKKLLSPFAFLSTPISVLMFPRLVSLYEQGEFQDLHKIVIRITLRLIYIALAGSFGVILLLNFYLSIQNVEATPPVYLATSLLLVQSLLAICSWWGRGFIILYNPMLPIYTNALLTLNGLWIPIVLFTYTESDHLTTIALSTLLAYIPSWAIGMYAYLHFLRSRGVIQMQCRRAPRT